MWWCEWGNNGSNDDGEKMKRRKMIVEESTQQIRIHTMLNSISQPAFSSAITNYYSQPSKL